MKVADAQQMREIDNNTIRTVKIPSIVLMEHAAQRVSDVCKKYLSKENSKVFIFCGKGNNGGDGFAIARLLKNEGIQVEIFLLGLVQDLTEDAEINFNIARKLEIPISFELEQAKKQIKDCDLIIDAVFGTGLKGDLRENAQKMVSIINASGKIVISVDIPSGIDADTGKVLGCAVQANETVTFALPKTGLLLYPGTQYAGKITVADISIPKFVIEQMGIQKNCLTIAEAKKLLPKRKQRSNKGSYGKLLVLAGSREMVGAAAFTGKSAYKTGAGLVYCASVKSALPVIQSLVPEAVEITLSEDQGKVRKESIEDLEGFLEKVDALVLGPGLGSGENVTEFVTKMVRNCDRPMIIDADGLNSLVGQVEILKRLKTMGVITPHPGEMSRLTGKSIAEILEYPIQTAIAFAKEYSVITVLKDARTVIAHPNGEVFINTTGNSSLSKGGSGDVLSGVIGGLFVQKMELFDAAVLGVYLHGLAGELAGKKLTEYGVLAGDLVPFISKAIKKILK